MQLRFFNTLSKQVEPFTPINANEVRIYSCGPTVYNVAHIGNMRSFLAADIIQRVTRCVGGYGVRWVMNITDIDDKIIRDSALNSERWPVELGAQTGDLHKNLHAFTAHYEKEFVRDITTLGILGEHFYAMPRATAYIQHMQKMVAEIVDNGYGYVRDGSVYFNVAKYAGKHKYGRLFTVDTSAMKEGVRIDADEYDRESVSDFVLWKARKAEEPFWEYELHGEQLPGRPGWHIECSAMSAEILGLPFDIHTGGVDLRFPHHEDELAQCCAAHHEPLQEQANYWLHNEFLEVEGKKMSKSLNNFYTLRDIVAQGYSPMDIRYAMVATHYRSVYNFSVSGLKSTSAARKNVQEYIWDLLERIPDISADATPDSVLLDAVFTALADDIHTPKAIAELFSFIAANPAATVNKPLAVLRALEQINAVFGVWVFTPWVPEEVPEQIQTLANLRWKAKQEKNWLDADKYRDELRALGWVMNDTKTDFSLQKIE